jgi:hypothetical protein
MLRFEVTEHGQATLPAVDLGEAVVTIGSSTGARIRLPAAVARDTHVRIDGTSWVAIADVRADGVARPAGDGGPLGDGVTFELGGYRVRVRPAPPGTSASPPQRTESLARELVRGLLGAGAAPSLELERGPTASSIGSSRALPPPEATLVIGRGDEAGWVILDEDLSRMHVEIRRGWDGVTIRDLDSKNGTRVGGVAVGDPIELHDGALVELGNIALRFRDPAERHLRGESRQATPRSHASPNASASGSTPRPSPWPFTVAAALVAIAVAALVWVLAS